jgi:hypothetical protein
MAKTTTATRKRTTRRSTSATARAGEFVCPDCGRTFKRAAALGAHRSRAHGIAGQSAQARKRRASRSQTSRASAGSTSTRTTTATGKRRSALRTTNRAATRSPGAGARNGIDRDALLKALFPNGIPAREDVLRAASGWLDDAERLARMR